MIIAVDFDGTCVKHAYPNVGEDIGAVSVLRELVNNGHRLILYTMRDKSQLLDAIDWFELNGIKLWDINRNPEQSIWTSSPKICADLYIDDAALGVPLIYQFHKRPYVDWNGVRQILVDTGVIV